MPRLDFAQVFGLGAASRRVKSCKKVQAFCKILRAFDKAQRNHVVRTSLKRWFERDFADAARHALEGLGTRADARQGPTCWRHARQVSREQYPR